jgi:photosystem II stability/assembly factor-like uncharacterized protein
MRYLTLLRLAGISAVLALAAACGSSASTGAPTDTPADTFAAATATPAASPTDTPTPTLATDPSATLSATEAATPTTGPAATPAPRVARVHGQTVKQDVLVAPGVGWVLTNSGLWQTIDDGSTWANAYPRRLIASTIRGLGALDANHALLAAVDVGHSTSTYYIWRTSDGGQTWAYTALTPIAHDVMASPCTSGDFCGAPGDPAATFDYVDANTAFVYIWMRTGFDGVNTSIFETTDGGRTWSAPLAYTPPDPGTGSGDAYRVQFMTPSIGVAEYDDQISSTITGWGHWTHRHLPTTDYSEPVISFLGTTKWYGDLGLDYGTVQYNYTDSTDQGHTWTNYTSSVPGIANLSSAQVQFLGPLEWIGTEGTVTGSGVGPSQTIYTIDGGHHWALEGAQPFNGSIAHFVDATHGWTGPNDQVPTARLYSTADGGRSWRLLTP